MRVLVAEDDVVFRRILESTLVKWDYQVVTASDGDEAWRQLQGEDAPHMALLDWMMPGLDGIEVCRRIRKAAPEPYTYVILLTARGQRGDLIAGLEAGADDYITKPFDTLELKGRLRAGRRILDLQADLVSARDELSYQATHDPLTRLWNRSAILNTLRMEMGRASHQHTALGVALADIDRFKQINDTYGHAAGDIVLCETAHRMTAAVRAYDSIGRYGGEEFLMVFPGCDSTNSTMIAERLRSAVGEQCIRIAQKQITVTISLGVTTMGPATGTDIDSLIQGADSALYRAKADGRNRIVLSALDEMPQPVRPV